MKAGSTEYKARYGRIPYRETIDARHPVTAVCGNDINRALMIKFKYGNMTRDESRAFHEAIKKIIYKVMHTNNVMMNWDDVYQEIWKKIVKCKHTWKEWKGTMVSTWITIVANSVINTLRQNVKRYNSRFCLYDDLMASSDSEEGAGQQNNGDSLAFENGDERLSDSATASMQWSEQYEQFRNSLEPAEAFVFGVAVSMSDDILDKYDRSLKIPYSELRARTGYDEATFAVIMYNIRKKYCEAFDTKFEERPVDSGDGESELLF